MKKRILALALTLAMVITSLSVLSFVSFADDAVAQNESTAKDFYAYRGTLNVDSRLGVDELWVPVNKEIAPSVAIGMSWDYENVYLAVYNEPATNGVAGARADYIDSFSFNVGGATATGSLTDDTTEVSGNGEVVLGYAGVDNYRCVIEAAFPLSEIELDTAKLAEGILSVPATLTINQVYADGTTPTTTAELNVILSGRSLAYQTDRINPTGAYANGTSMFGGGHVYDRTVGAYASGSDDFKANAVFSGGQGNVNAHLIVVDKMLTDGKIEFVRNSVNLHEFVSVSDGGQSYAEYQFIIKNLPVNGEMTHVDNPTDYVNKPSYIAISSTGLGNTNMGTLANIYNAGGDAGLSVYYPTASGNKSVSLGVAEGESFWIGFNEVATNKIEIYVNDVCIASDMIASSASATSDRGYVWVASHRGNSGVGTNGYSLDLNEDGVVDDEECISYTMGDSAFANVAPVDVATVASLTKTGGVASSTQLMAGFTAKNTVNVASLATATATYSLAKGIVSVSVADVANIDSVKVNVGGFEATATIGIANADARPDTMGATLDAESVAAGATASINQKGLIATINVPVSKVAMTKDNAGNAVADVQIYVEKSDKASDKDDRVNCVTDGTFNGTIVFATDDVTNIMSPVVLNTAGAACTDGSKNFVGGGVGTENYGKLIYTQAEGQARTVDSYFTSLGASYGVAGTRDMYFDITVTDMTPIPVENVTFDGGFTQTAKTFDRVTFHFGTNVGDVLGSVRFNLVNTTNGGTDGGESLVLVYSNMQENGKIYIIPLDKKLGDTFHFEFLWDYPTYGFVKIDDKVILEKDDMRTHPDMKHITGSATSGPYFRVMRGTETGTAAFNFTIENLTLNTRNHAHTTARVLAAGANSNVVTSTGSIKLSYVQETIYTAPVTGNAYTHSALGGNGGSAADGNATMSVKNTASRAYAQGGLLALATYANRTIEFNLNVANLNAYDFSNGGTLSGNAKYTENINAAHGIQQGIGNGDLTVHAFDKLLIGAIGNISDDGVTRAAMAMYVVRDTNDGLVIVHTTKDGVETVVVIGDKMATDIAVTLVWNKDNTGAIVVDGAKTALADCRTVQTSFPKRDADNGPQCYFGGYGTVKNGYFGLNSVWSTDNATEGYVAPEASLTLTNVTVGTALNVRFVATIDTLNAKEAGFEINLKDNAKVKTLSTDTAYNAISVNGDLEKIYAPDGSYFIALNVNNVPANGTVTFVVRPYFTYGGNTTYGTAYEVTYTNGAYVGAVAVAD